MQNFVFLLQNYRNKVCINCNDFRDDLTAFPGSLFFPSLEREKEETRVSSFSRSREGKKRDPGNEVGDDLDAGNTMAIV